MLWPFNEYLVLLQGAALSSFGKAWLSVVYLGYLLVIYGGMTLGFSLKVEMVVFLTAEGSLSDGGIMLNLFGTYLSFPSLFVFHWYSALERGPI